MANELHILLTNDDGIHAPGLNALYKQLTKLGQVSVVAPEAEKSGAGQSITLEPLKCKKVETNEFRGYSVSGSPTDCVKLAVRELVGPEIDIVVSGINHGANVGVNLRYSGTVAAAMEGAIQNIPAVAISSSFEQEPNSVDFDSSAEYSLEILEKLLPMRPGDVFNVNIPRLSRGKPKGIKVALQSQVPYREKYINHKNKGSSAVYQITGQPPYYGQAPYDTAYVEQGYITITALSLDMTNNAKNTELEKIQW